MISTLRSIDDIYERTKNLANGLKPQTLIERAASRDVEGYFVM